MMILQNLTVIPLVAGELDHPIAVRNARKPMHKKAWHPLSHYVSLANKLSPHKFFVILFLKHCLKANRGRLGKMK